MCPRERDNVVSAGANEWVSESQSGGRGERRPPSIDTAVDVARNSKGVNRTGETPCLNVFRFTVAALAKALGRE